MQGFLPTTSGTLRRARRDFSSQGDLSQRAIEMLANLGTVAELG